MIDDITRHQIYLQRLGSQLANSFDPYLASTDKLVREILTRIELNTQRDLNNALSELREGVGNEYGAYVDEVNAELEELAEYESGWMQQLLVASTVGATIVGAGASAWQMSRKRPIQLGEDGQSALLENYLSGFAVQNVDRILGIVRNSYYQGETQQQIIKRIRGTKANKYKDGVLALTKRYAGVVARTSSNHVAAQAKMATLMKNKDLFKGWEFLATLDRRTTKICRRLDQLGELYPIGEGPIPPLHPGCRSVIEPVLKNTTGLLDSDDMRASSGAKGGQTVKDQGYYDWLGAQPKWFQQEVLGKAQTELFRKGGLSTDDFARLTTNNFGEPLTLAEIEQKDQLAWNKAGL